MARGLGGVEEGGIERNGRGLGGRAALGDVGSGWRRGGFLWERIG